MSLLDLIQSSAGQDALQKIGARVGLSPEQLETAVTSLAPALGPKLAEHAATGGLNATVVQEPGSDSAVDQGNDILGKIFGSKDVSRSVASDASARTGINADTLKALLPLLASVATTVIAARQNRSETSDGGLGGILGGILGRLGR